MKLKIKLLFLQLIILLLDRRKNYPIGEKDLLILEAVYTLKSIVLKLESISKRVR